jgi:hypothetical protein
MLLFIFECFPVKFKIFLHFSQKWVQFVYQTIHFGGEKTVTHTIPLWHHMTMT